MLRSPRRLFVAIALVALAFVVVPVGEAQAQMDVSGTWNLRFDTDTSLNNCVYAGTGTFSQAGGPAPNPVSGNINMALVSGGAACPPQMSGPLNVAAEIAGAAFTLAITNADFGQGVLANLTVTGAAPGDTLGATAPPNAQNVPVTVPPLILGTFTGTKVPSAPTLPQWAAIVMLFLLAAAGAITLRRRQMATPEV